MHMKYLYPADHSTPFRYYELYALLKEIAGRER